MESAFFRKNPKTKNRIFESTRESSVICREGTLGSLSSVSAT